jgi:A/G-specific adenine glycosylase
MSTSFAEPVLAWYARNARDLPWRAPDATPWGVLVSEIMLQQTPVARVLPEYLGWMTRWPTPAALAAEPAGEAIRQWGRLGYPRRALRLHETATILVARYGGSVPADLVALRALPGIGSYTAAAVASFAFGQRHAVLDTNVRRVLARLAAGQPWAGGSSSASVAERRLAESLLPAEPAVAARWSVAVMELGALVCTAASPRCGDCPVARECAWLAAGRPAPPAGTAGTAGSAGVAGTAGTAGAARSAGVTGTAGAAGAGRRRTQKYEGTDRQCRGRLLAVLRGASDPVQRAAFDAVWAGQAQLERALDGLVADGLVDPLPDGRFALPGSAPLSR